MYLVLSILSSMFFLAFQFLILKSRTRRRGGLELPKVTGVHSAGYCKYIESIAKNGRPGGEQWSCRCQADPGKQEARLTSWSPTQLGWLRVELVTQKSRSRCRNGFHKFCKSLAIERVHERRQQFIIDNPKAKNEKSKRTRPMNSSPIPYPYQLEIRFKERQDLPGPFRDALYIQELWYRSVYRVDKLHYDKYNHDSYFRRYYNLYLYSMLSTYTIKIDIYNISWRYRLKCRVTKTLTTELINTSWKANELKYIEKNYFLQYEIIDLSYEGFGLKYLILPPSHTLISF